MEIPVWQPAIIAHQGKAVPVSQPVPCPQAGQVLLQLAFAGVNRPDLLQVKGLYPAPQGHSPVPGLEASGTVVATGENSMWQIGDRVCALLEGGGYAPYALADSALCLPVPDTLPLEQAACLPEGLVTLWSNLEGCIPPGSAVLIHGGSGGLGHLAIQLCKQHFGAFVFTTARREAADFCRSLGADVVIDYRHEDFAAVVRDHPRYPRVTLVLDILGGEATAGNLAVLAPDGTLLQLAFQHGSRISADMLPLMLKRLTWTGSTLRSRPLTEKRVFVKGVLETLWPLVIAGFVRPRLAECLPLEQAADALQRLEVGGVFGKIVLDARHFSNPSIFNNLLQSAANLSKPHKS